MDFAKLAIEESSALCEKENDKNIYQIGFLNGIMIAQNEFIDAFERAYEHYLHQQNDAYWENLKFKMANYIRKDLASTKK